MYSWLEGATTLNWEKKGSQPTDKITRGPVDRKVTLTPEHWVDIVPEPEQSQAGLDVLPGIE